MREVRTKDDTLLRVKLMIFFELNDIDKMLDNTHDPIGIGRPIFGSVSCSENQIFGILCDKDTFCL